MKYLKIAGITSAILVPLIVITVLVVLRLNLHDDQSDLQEEFQQTLASIESSEDIIEYVEVEPYLFNTVECSKTNLLSVVRQSNVDADIANVVATSMALLNECSDPWQVRYNNGYCDTFTLLFDSDASCLKSNVYNEGYVVTENTGTGEMFYAHGTVFTQVPTEMAESLAYLLNQADTWNWNNSEAALVLGKLSEEYPDKEVSVFEDTILLDGEQVMTVSNGILKYPSYGEFTGTMYAMYPNLKASVIAENMFDRSLWFPADTLNIVAIVDLLEELGYPVFEGKLAELFTAELPDLFESWTYEIDGCELKVSTVEYDPSVVGNINGKWLFSINTDNGDFRKSY